MIVGLLSQRVPVISFRVCDVAHDHDVVVGGGAKTKEGPGGAEGERRREREEKNTQKTTAGSAKKGPDNNHTDPRDPNGIPSSCIIHG